jgi:hypothetical protein
MFPTKIPEFFRILLVLLAMIRTYAAPFASRLQRSTPLRESLLILGETGRRLYSVWPLWFVVLIYLLIIADGSPSKRLKKASGELVVLVVLGLLVHLLATWNSHL